MCVCVWQQLLTCLAHWCSWLSPQLYTSPLDDSASVCTSPAAIATMRRGADIVVLLRPSPLSSSSSSSAAEAPSALGDGSLAPRLAGLLMLLLHAF